MKIALITDTHFGARNDSQTFANYFADFYEDIFFPYLEEHNIDTVIHLGDIVERRKFINFVTLDNFKKTFIQPCEERNIKLHIIVGNHDIPFRNSNELNAMDLLFADYCELMRVYSSPSEIEFDGCNIALVPWIHNQNYDKTMSFLKETKAQICLGHLEIGGFAMYRGLPAMHGMSSKPFEKFELVCSGHFHTKSEKDNIHYLGTPYEITWSDYNDRRGFHVLDTDTRELEFVQNPYRMFHKLFYNDSEITDADIRDMDLSELLHDRMVKIVVQEKNNPYWFDMYLDKIYATNPLSVNIVEDNHHMDEIREDSYLNEAEDTLTLLRHYTEQMDVKVDINKLQNLLSELYVEAQTIEF